MLYPIVRRDDPFADFINSLFLRPVYREPFPAEASNVVEESDTLPGSRDDEPTVGDSTSADIQREPADAGRTQVVGIQGEVVLPVTVPEPIRGENEPIRGENEPRGEHEPIRGENEPRGEHEPIRGENEPIRGENEPIRGENEPLLGEFYLYKDHTGAFEYRFVEPDGPTTAGGPYPSKAAVWEGIEALRSRASLAFSREIANRKSPSGGGPGQT